MFRTVRKSMRHLNTRLTLNRLEDRTVPNGSVLRWHTIATDAVRDDHGLTAPRAQFGPTRAARAMAIVQAAVFDAVNSIDRSYQPYKFQVAAAPDASIDAAVAAAARDTLVYLYPAYQSRFDTYLAQDLATIPSSAGQHGAAVGHQVAQQLIALRTNDGSQLDPTYTFINQPGYWQVDPFHPTQEPLGAGWGDVTPFTMVSNQQFHIPAPPALNSPEYAAAYNEVKAYGGDGITTPTIRTLEQSQIGIYWGYDGQPGLCSPPRLYNQIAAHIAVQQGNSNVQNARLFALVNLALVDASISCWEDKFYYSFWRPVTAIQQGDTDNNPNTVADPTFHPFGAPADNGGGTNFTPPFPSYSSGHATLGGAVFRMLANFYGTDHIPFTFVSDEFNGKTFDMNGQVRPILPRHFETFTQAAEENGQSRIYLGIHFSFDKTAGIASGTQIADFAFKNFLRARSKVQRFAVGADAGAAPHVRVFNTVNGAQLAGFFAYDIGFRGGVRVAMGDVNGDGTPDLITAAGPGGGPHVKVFDGNTFALLLSFFAYDSGFHGGLFVSSGDVNNDGFDDIVTGADAGGGPHVRAFSGANLTQLRSFFAYGSTFSGGVRVATGDIDGDGFDDIITGAGPGGGPHVAAFSGASGAVLRSFYAYDSSFRGGVFVSAGDTDGNGKADIVTGAGAGGGPHVQVFNGAGAMLKSFFAFLPAIGVTTRGVRVGTSDFDGDGRADLLTGAGPGDLPLVECRDGVSLTELERALKFDPAFLGGVFVGGA